MRLIDADALIKKIPTEMDMQELYLPIHFKEWLIDEAPTVDAMPVVRCKECKWYGTYQLTKYGEYDKRYKPTVCIKGEYSIMRNEDWYCADGERKDNDRA